MNRVLADLGIVLHRDGPGQHRAPCPECGRGPKDTALAVRLNDDGSAVWLCHRCGYKGRTVGEWSAARRPAPRLQLVRHSTDKTAWAADIWGTTRALDGPAVAYLTEARHCPLPPAEGDLRWHPDLCVFGHSGPALVGRISHAADHRQLLGLHLTWLARKGNRWTRTERRYLGKKQSGVIRLWPDEAVSAALAVGEGIETCLSGSRLMTPVWCAMDAGNLAALPVLEGIESLVVLADDDRAGIDAALSVMERWEAAGREVRATVPQGAKDLNEVPALWTH